MYAPVGGVVVAVNEALADNPQLLNEDPYGEGWLIEIEAGDMSQFVALLDAEGYRALTEG
jgi:glycine cleavage system H protein